MFLSTSASRKRPAAADLFCNVTSSNASLTAPRPYQTKLLLGDYRSEHVEPMDHESVNENYQMSAKRNRISQIRFEHFTVPARDAEAVADLLVARANMAFEEAAPADNTRRHPLDLQKNIRLNTAIIM